MYITINDLSFLFPFYSETDFQAALRQFIQMCKELESSRCHNVAGITRAEIDKTFPIYPNGSLYKAIQHIADNNEKKYFLSLLVNRGCQTPASASAFLYRGKSSTACAAAKDDAVVSLESEEGFRKASFQGEISAENVSIKNISRNEHILFYREMLGLRIYEPNREKHKKDRDNPYGKGKVASPMDLPDEEAQELLDRAIFVKNRLYARKGENNYAFMNTIGCIYHGYIAADLGDDILTELNKTKWD